MCRWIARNVVAVAQGLCVAGCRLAGVPMEGDLARAPGPSDPRTASGTASGTVSGTASGDAFEGQPWDGPPPGHPERLVPPDLTLSPAEWELWCQLGGVIRWPI